MTALYNQWQSLLRGLSSVSILKSPGFSPEYFKKEQFQDNSKTLWTKVKKFRIACKAGFPFKQQPLATFSLLFNISFELMILLVIKDCSILPPKQAGSSYHSHWPFKKWSWDVTHCAFLLSATITTTPNLMAILLLKFAQNDSKRIRDLLSKDAFYQATKQVGQTSTAF